jgi:hypothetical protein
MENWLTVLTPDGGGSRHEPSFAGTGEPTAVELVIESIIFFVVESDSSRSWERVWGLVKHMVVRRETHLQ